MAPDRAVAIIVALVAQPLAGAGLYVLGRRSAVVWMIAGLCRYAATIASVIAKAPAVFIVDGRRGRDIVAGRARVHDVRKTRNGAAPRGNRSGAVRAVFDLAARGGALAAKKWVAEAYHDPVGRR